MKKLWENPVYVKKVINAQQECPNYFEQGIEWFINDVCNELEVENYFHYNGDGRVCIIDRCEPDFINFKGNEIIEGFGDHCHENSDEIKKKKFYNDRGFRCHIIWASDFYSRNNWQAKRAFDCNT